MKPSCWYSTARIAALTVSAQISHDHIATAFHFLISKRGAGGAFFSAFGYNHCVCVFVCVLSKYIRKTTWDMSARAPSPTTKRQGERLLFVRSFVRSFLLSIDMYASVCLYSYTLHPPLSPLKSCKLTAAAAASGMATSAALMIVLDGCCCGFCCCLRVCFGENACRIRVSIGVCLFPSLASSCCHRFALWICVLSCCCCSGCPT